MVFHGDYETEYEIYQLLGGSPWPILVGHIPATSSKEARERWITSHSEAPNDYGHISAKLPQKKKWK